MIFKWNLKILQIKLYNLIKKDIKKKGIDRGQYNFLN